MGRYLELAASGEPLTKYEINEINEKRSVVTGIAPAPRATEIESTLREAVSERAAILEYDAGLPRAEAEREAEKAYRVFVYRLSDAPAAWITMIAPAGCTLAEAEAKARFHHGNRVIEVRPHVLPRPTA
jgi:hypothetical protein